jgi:HD-GYP domain-containing protein (c-di-GMP phosphodiesterase class II)
MATQQQKIEVGNLKVGMYIANLDRPWCETPFPLQGFYIRSNSDIQDLERYCKYVYVDKKTIVRAVSDLSLNKIQRKVKSGMAGTKKQIRPEAAIYEMPPIRIRNPVKYEQQSSLKIEIKQAEKVKNKIYDSLHQIFNLAKQGQHISLKETAAVAGLMVETVTRNADALVWLTRLDDHHNKSYRHSVNASVWALIFGRHLGLDKALLSQLAAGVLLAQVGKSLLPQALLDTPLEELNDEELVTYRNYVDLGVDILTKSGQAPKSIISVVQYHQERHNGTGYPIGAMGDHIPLLAKIGGLVDYYQSLIEPLSLVRALSPSEAVSNLFELRNIKFQSDLVERFIQAVGVYPTGTLVELDSHEVAVVIGNNQERKLLPKVMIVLDEDKQPYKPAKVIDLKTWNEQEKLSKPLKIKGCLAKGSYDIDASKYLVTGATSKWSLKHLFAS